MTDSPENLDARLRQLRPRPLNPAIGSRVAAALDVDAAAPVETRLPRNRFFWSAVTSGAIAACVIAGVCLSEPPPARTDPFHQSPAGTTASSGPELGALARADWRMSDEFAPDLHRSHR